MADEKEKNTTNQNMIQQALTYAQGTNGLENHVLTIEELKQIERDVQSGRCDRSFLMAVLEYVSKKKAQQDALAGDGYGRPKK